MVALDVEESIPANQNVFKEFDMKDTLAALDGYITTLPPQQQKVFLLSREQNLSNKEIAEELGISVKAVEANITRAIKYLKGKVGYKWILLVLFFQAS